VQIKVKDLKKIKIASDECLLIKISSDLSLDETERIYKIILEALPKGTKILLYSDLAIEKLQVVKQL